MVEHLEMFFKRKNWDFVELEGKKVYLKPINNGMFNRARIKSALNDKIFSNAIFYTEMEKEITGFSQKKLDNLSLSAGRLLRQKVIAILKKEGLVKEEIKPEVIKEDKADIFSKQDVEWFEKSKHAVMDKWRKTNA